MAKNKPTKATSRITPSEAYSAVAFSDCYSRMAVLIQLAPQMERAEWLTLVGDWWSVCSNLEFHQGTLKALLGTHGPIAEMMSAEERKQWEALPDELTCYRVCEEKYVSGPSWSLAADTAARFPAINPFKPGERLLLTGIVRKDSVLALKLDREAPELISFSVRLAAVHKHPSA